MNKITKRQEGFTIIEVMIVLVIAAVILLIVFLAVPALQRNSRNTQRKNEVSALLAGATEFETNNAGAAPSKWDTAAVTATAGSQFLPASGTAGAVRVKLGFYDPTADVLAIKTGTQTALDKDTDVGHVRIVTGATCGTAGATDSKGASSRQIVAQYVLEGSTNTPTCQEG